MYIYPPSQHPTGLLACKTKAEGQIKTNTKIFIAGSPNKHHHDNTMVAAVSNHLPPSSAHIWQGRVGEMAREFDFVTECKLNDILISALPLFLNIQ